MTYIVTRQSNDSTAETIAEAKSVFAAIRIVRNDVRARLPESEKPGCPIYRYAIGLVIGRATATPRDDGKEELRVSTQFHDLDEL